ncbi:uncharacterized protein TrAtP1_002883 [Trichoderma atroviride]|uniref:Uncharacterized protein n=1 Tax=Hypocrea atroviridis (strain ATCC 20476 / IMI 206040) TaxID=452589 RepID=G9NXF3_HYPAI|nr:uncharacterized protein TRIATDRAFT_88312 [Trichoderma atroviride IMI 206040]EHK44763.1 hypothetical protein TRIATDRAFT_88312 [Trichoderma atroviride IMI 206040]UKZ61623.1 hypothetical protein TrAtP1_002883 [Trichoderma atroviride]
MTPVVYIHGHFNGCNLALAEELSKLMPKTKIIDDNLNVEPAKAFAKTLEEYRCLRVALRRTRLQSIYKSEEASEATWVMIDQFDPEENRGSLAADYEFAAVMSHSPLISIILKFDVELACKRARERFTNGTASYERVKVLENLRIKCETEEVFRFRNNYELELDVTMMSPTEAAETVRAHIQTVKRRLQAEDRRSWIRIY